MLSIQILLIFSCLLLTGYSNEFYNASMPEEINALVGSCVQIPCSFYVSDFSEKLRDASNTVHGVWIKHKPQFGEADSLVVFNGTTNLTRGFRLIELVGNLSQSNCTTVFHGLRFDHSDSYFFRIEMSQFKATFNYEAVRNKPLRITVTDSPQKPKMTSVGEVKEGTTVTLTCSVDAPCPKFVPVLSWSSPLTTGEPLTQFRQNVDKTTSLFSNLTFTVSYPHHMINTSCNVTYPTKNENYTSAETTMIRVAFSPKETKATIEPPHPVPVGSNVSLSCQSRANPTVDNYTWYREGEQTPKGFGSRIIMSVTAEDQGQYYCQATNTQGSHNSSSVLLAIENSPQKPNMASVGEVKEGTTVTLTCSVDVPCPKFVPVLSWSSPLTTGEPLSQFRQNVDKTTSLFSNLTFTVSYTHHMINISCNVTYPTESGSYISAETTIIRVFFSPKETKATIEPPHPVPVGSNVSLSCQSRANPTVENYTWYREGEQTPKGFGSRIIMSVTAEDQGQYYCQATNTQGSQNSSSVLLTVERQPESKVIMSIGCAGGAAVLLLLCVLIVCVIRGKKSRKSDMKKEKNPSQEGENPSQSEKQDEIHYGEIDFSKLQTKNTSGPRQKPEVGSETEYAEVKGLQTKRPPETGREKEDIYSVVKKT